MDVTRKQLTNVEPGKGLGGPMNSFANVAAYPTADMRVVVRPNFDTLFFTNAHEPGNQTLLGKVYPAGGVEQGEAALGDLARHSATRRHVARNLARHFVADKPPDSLVAKLEKVFRDTDGDLKSVSVALFMRTAILDHPGAECEPVLACIGSKHGQQNLLGSCSSRLHTRWIRGCKLQRSIADLWPRGLRAAAQRMG